MLVQIQSDALMTELDDHISRVERYGLKRSQFPLQFNGHTIEILQNDAYKTNDGRLLFDFALICQSCDKESGTSGRFSANNQNQISHVCNARVAVLGPYSQKSCENLK